MTTTAELVALLRDPKRKLAAYDERVAMIAHAATALETLVQESAAKDARIAELEAAYRVETMRSARMADAMRDKDETRAASMEKP